MEKSLALIEQRWEHIKSQADLKLTNLNTIEERWTNMARHVACVEEFIVFCEQSFNGQSTVGIDKEIGHEQLSELDVSFCTPS